MNYKNLFIIFLFFMTYISVIGQNEYKFSVLVFTKTAGYRHSSIDDGALAILKLGKANNFKVDTTGNSSSFTKDKLNDYEVVVFLNTTGNVLNAEEQLVFENYIQAGGGFLGIHAAADCEYDWKWYGNLVGAYFNGHPAIQKADVNITDRKNAITKHLPKNWKREDELYNYKSINPNIEVLATLDESTYKGGTNGDNHPIIWYHNYNGGRSFYIGLGHTKETYEDSNFLRILLGGIDWASNKGINNQE